MRARLEPLSPGRVRVEFTARAEFRDKLEQARQLLSHAVPSGDLGELFERALDALLEKETRRRFGAGRPRKRRQLKEGSRHVPVEVQRAVWERDGAQCTFVDSEGRRCSERHFLTIEHQHPHARGGAPTVDNLCLLCQAHNFASARKVFGEDHIEAKIRSRALAGTARAGREPSHAGDVRGQPPSTGAATGDPPFLTVVSRVIASLCQLGFRRRDAAAAIGRIAGNEPDLGFEQLLRKSLLLLVPAAA